MWGVNIRKQNGYLSFCNWIFAAVTVLKKGMNTSEMLELAFVACEAIVDIIKYDKTQITPTVWKMFEVGRR